MRIETWKVRLSKVRGVVVEAAAYEDGTQLVLDAGADQLPLIGWYTKAQLKEIRAFLRK